MQRHVTKEVIIPASQGAALEVKKGEVLRIYLVEDRQVGDCVFFNAHDYREVFHVGQTWAMNVILGTGTAKNFKHFYSKPPRENVMLPVAPQWAFGRSRFPISQMTSGTPPAVGTLRKAPFAKKPTQSPSGEKKGDTAPSVPGTALAPRRSSVRRKSCDVLPDAAV